MTQKEKSSNAPEKIYITPHFQRRWFMKEIDDVSIEYIRGDVFIEKFECWINENFYNHSGEFDERILAPFDRIEDAIENFKKYIEV